MEEQLQFNTAKDFHLWLSANKERMAGLWLLFGKNGKLASLTAEEALDEALCFGWIDGLIKGIDDTCYKKYFALRRKGSPWSEKNRKAVERLITEGRMTERGDAVILRAKSDGTWYAVHDRSIPPEDFVAFERAISASPVATANYTRMPLSVKMQFAATYKDAKKNETRIRRLAKLIGLLEQNKRPI